MKPPPHNQSLQDPYKNLTPQFKTLNNRSLHKKYSEKPAIKMIFNLQIIRPDYLEFGVNPYSFEPKISDVND